MKKQEYETSVEIMKTQHEEKINQLQEVHESVSILLSSLLVFLRRRKDKNKERYSQIKINFV